MKPPCSPSPATASRPRMRWLDGSIPRNRSRRSSPLLKIIWKHSSPARARRAKELPEMTSVKILIPSAFRRHTEGADHYNCPAADLNSLLDSLGNRFPELKTHLR